MKGSIEPIRTFSDPEKARDDRFVEAAKAFADAVASEGESKPQVAARLGITATELARLCSHASGRHAPLGHAKGLSLNARIAIANWLVGPTHAVVELPSNADRGTCDLSFLASAVRDVSEAVSTALLAAADLRFDRQEAGRIRPLVRRGIAILGAIDQLAQSAEREGVIGLRAGGAA